MKHGLILPNPIVGDDPTLMVEYAIAAEAAGWDGVFMWDVLVNPAPPDELGQRGDPTPWRPEAFEPLIDPIVTLSGIATRTESLTLGTWIVPAARRQPWQLARDLATLDRLSRGRVVLGVGLGRRTEYELFGTDWDASTIGRRYDETLELLDRFWSGEPVHHRGEHFTVDGVALLPTPLQRPRIPIFVAGFWPNPRPVRRAARWDGFMPVVDPDPDGGDLVDLCEAYAEAAPDRRDVFLCVGPDATTPERMQRYDELGVTWLGSYCLDESLGRDGNLAQIALGPPPR